MNGIYYVLALIMMVESSGQKIGMHPDGKSYGLFGLTEIACTDIGEKWPPETPKDELRCAKKYLERMSDRWNCGKDWFTAAGFYHGGDSYRRETYVHNLMELEGVPNVTNRFNEIFRRYEADAENVAGEIQQTCHDIDPLEGPDAYSISKLENRILQLADAIKEIKNRK